MGMGEFALILITFILLFGGMFLTLVPALPALPFMFLTVFAYAVVTKFTTLSLMHILILAGVVALSLLVDGLAGILRYKYGGVGRKPLIYGLIGMAIGIILMPPFGSLLGLFTGIMLSEILAYNEHHKMIRNATGAVLGVVFNIMTNFGLAFVFIGLFASFLYK